MVTTLIKVIAGIIIAILFLVFFVWIVSSGTDWEIMQNTILQLEGLITDIGESHFSVQTKTLILPSIVESVTFTQKIGTCNADGTSPECGGKQCSSEECSYGGGECIGKECIISPGDWDNCKRLGVNPDSKTYIAVAFEGKSPICIDSKKTIDTNVVFREEEVDPHTIMLVSSYTFVLNGCYSYSLTITTKEKWTTINIDRRSYICPWWEPVTRIFR